MILDYEIVKADFTYVSLVARLIVEKTKDYVKKYPELLKIVPNALNILEDEVVNTILRDKNLAIFLNFSNKTLDNHTSSVILLFCHYIESAPPVYNPQRPILHFSSFIVPKKYSLIATSRLVDEAVRWAAQLSSNKNL
jgi:hypothetical protein